jgi:hypothetical protein
LDAATRGFNDAAARLQASRARQAQLADQMRGTDAQLAELTDQVGVLAATAYKGGEVTEFTALLDSNSPDGLFQRVITLESKARADDARIRQAKQAKAALDRQQAAVDTEVKLQQDQLAEMDKRKKAAEKALASVGGTTATGFTGGSTTAAPAPRNADGSFSSQSCSVKDPTTSGCLTPRTLNALQQVQGAGFTRFASCYRPQQDGGEHPKGRACDLSASANGFGGVAGGGDRDYGNRLAAWLVANAQRLGVLYVIWFRQIWLPSSGWRAYNGGGDPSSDHTNHVHMSIQ